MLLMNKRASYTKILAFCFIIFFALPSKANNLSITQAGANPQVLTEQNRLTNIQFSINKPSDVVVTIFDATDALVWRSDRLQLPTGVNVVAWNGRNIHGQLVPPEAYHYVIQASTTGNENALYDLTDITGGEKLTIENIRYDAKTKKLTFTAPRSGRYIMRVGIARAFAINTLINNKVVAEGEHEITWDGYDASHVLDASQHPQLQFGGEGFQLSRNTIIVASSKNEESEIYKSRHWYAQEKISEHRKSNKIVRDDVSANFYRPVDQSRDVMLDVTLQKTTKKNKKGAYIISDETPLTVNLLPEDILVMESQRGEIVLFLDGQLIHDNEVSYYPYVFKWQPKIYDGIEHLLTVFVAGFAGNIGIATIRVQLDANHSSPSLNSSSISTKASL